MSRLVMFSFSLSSPRRGWRRVMIFYFYVIRYKNFQTFFLSKDFSLSLSVSRLFLYGHEKNEKQRHFEEEKGRVRQHMNQLSFFESGGEITHTHT